MTVNPDSVRVISMRSPDSAAPSRPSATASRPTPSQPRGRRGQGVADLVFATLGTQAHGHTAPRGVQRERRAQLVVEDDAARGEIGRRPEALW